MHAIVRCEPGNPTQGPRVCHHHSQLFPPLTAPKSRGPSQIRLKEIGLTEAEFTECLPNQALQVNPAHVSP